jgi:hypothetical protein
MYMQQIQLRTEEGRDDRRLLDYFNIQLSVSPNCLQSRSLVRGLLESLRRAVDDHNEQVQQGSTLRNRSLQEAQRNMNEIQNRRLVEMTRQATPRPIDFYERLYGIFGPLHSPVDGCFPDDLVQPNHAAWEHNVAIASGEELRIPLKPKAAFVRKQPARKGYIIYAPASEAAELKKLLLEAGMPHRFGQYIRPSKPEHSDSLERHVDVFETKIQAIYREPEPPRTGAKRSKYVEHRTAVLSLSAKDTVINAYLAQRNPQVGESPAERVAFFAIGYDWQADQAVKSLEALVMRRARRSYVKSRQKYERGIRVLRLLDPDDLWPLK